jgi:chemotaxis protein CheX
MPLSQKILQTLGIAEDLLTQHLKHDVKEIFNTMVGLDDMMHIPVQIDPVTEFKDCISSLVGFAGKFNGLVSIHMPMDLAKRVAGSMLEMHIDEINDDVTDALGEIANMIAGSFKLHLSVNSFEIHLSTPSVICGKEYVVSLNNKLEQFAVRFATDDDWFMVAVAFEEN